MAPFRALGRAISRWLYRRVNALAWRLDPEGAVQTPQPTLWAVNDYLADHGWRGR